MLSSPSLRSDFVFSIIPLTPFHLAEASLSTFLWLYTFACAAVQNIKKCLPFTIIHIFRAHFAINLIYFHNLKT